MKFAGITLLFSIIFSFYMHAQVVPGDSLALVAIYNTTNGPGWDVDSNWLEGPVTNWHGITVRSNRVKRINLYKNNLSGPFPDTITALTELESVDLASNMLTGSLPEDIGKLDKMTYLRINSNELEGEIPESFGDCSSIESVRIYSNNFTGTFPQSISKLSNLNYFVAYKNNFSGPFPEVFLSMKQLATLNISSNDFTGQIPATIDSLVNLNHLNLHGNSFTGTMPKIHHLVNLRTLHLSTQDIEGELDTILGYHPKLSYMTANFNQFIGRISTSHFEADVLKYLHLNGNQFTAIDDFTPFADTGVFERLYVSYNLLDFDDLEPNADLSVTFTYQDQAAVGMTDTVYLDAGENYEIYSPMQSPMIEYTWFKDGDKIPGANGTSLAITGFDGTQVGEYSFSSTHPDFPDLIIERNPVTILDANPSALKSIPDVDWTLSPNPADDQVAVQWTDVPAVKSKLTVFNANGQKVTSASFTQHCLIHCEHWPPGVYTIQLIKNHKVGIKRIVKQ